MFDLYGLGEIGNSLVIVLFPTPGPAPKLVAIGVLRVNLYGLGVVGNGLVIVFFALPGVAARGVSSIEVFPGKLARRNGLGVKPYGLVKLLPVIRLGKANHQGY